MSHKDLSALQQGNMHAPFNFLLVVPLDGRFYLIKTTKVHGPVNHFGIIPEDLKSCSNPGG